MGIHCLLWKDPHNHDYTTNSVKVLTSALVTYTLLQNKVYTLFPSEYSKCTHRIRLGPFWLQRGCYSTVELQWAIPYIFWWVLQNVGFEYSPTETQSWVYLTHVWYLLVLSTWQAVDGIGGVPLTQPWVILYPVQNTESCFHVLHRPSICHYLPTCSKMVIGAFISAL